MYADDTVVFLESDNPLTSQKLMTDDLAKHKCKKTLVFGTQKMITKYNDFSLQIGNSKIELKS